MLRFNGQCESVILCRQKVFVSSNSKLSVLANQDKKPTSGERKGPDLNHLADCTQNVYEQHVHGCKAHTGVIETENLQEAEKNSLV